jgi:hypothetical protein
VETNSTSTARQLRFALYAFGRKARKLLASKGEEGEVVAALDELSITVEGNTLVAYKKVDAHGMQALAAFVGEELGDLGKGAQEREADASLQRLLGMVGGVEGTGQISPEPAPAADVPAPRVTPYYTR